MPRQYSDGGRTARGPFGRTPQGPLTTTSKSLKERVGALKNLRPFSVMVWRASPQLTAASLVLRLVGALLPIITLFVGKLIIDHEVVLAHAPRKFETLRTCLYS